MSSTTYIVPFIKAVASVFKDMLGIVVTRGEPVDEGEGFESQGFAVIVGFTGGWRGRFFLDMPPATAIKVAGILTGEEYDSATHEEVLLCGAEIGNVVCGNAITAVNDAYPGLGIRLTPPSVFVGEGFSMFNVRLSSYSVMMQTDAGPLKINVAVEEGKR